MKKTFKSIEEFSLFDKNLSEEDIQNLYSDEFEADNPSLRNEWPPHIKGDSMNADISYHIAPSFKKKYGGTPGDLSFENGTFYYNVGSEDDPSRR